MRYLFFLLPILFISSSFASADELDGDSEVAEGMSEEDNEQNLEDQDSGQISVNQEDSDEEDEKGSDTRQSASVKSKRQDDSVDGDSSQQEFEEDQQHGTRANQSIVTASAGGDKVKIIQHKARFDPVTHEIVIETEPVEPQYLNEVISIDQESSTETDSFEYRNSEESSRNITHEIVIETEPAEPRYLNDEYWTENGTEEEKNFSKQESVSKENESDMNEEETDTETDSDD